MTATLLAPLRCPLEIASDPTLARNVTLYLQAKGIAVVEPLAVEAQGGIVTVAGKVRSFYDRQLAVACARRVAGVQQVVDRLQVPEVVARN